MSRQSAAPVHEHPGHAHEHPGHAHEHPGHSPEHPGQTHAHAGHTRTHGHDHPPETYADRPHPEFVALDIGGDVGALIVHTDSDLHGVEVEISPAADDARRSHKEVLERQIAGRPAFTGVFDGLRQGRYTLWMNGEPRARGVAVTGGEIAQVDWRGPPPTGSPAD